MWALDNRTRYAADRAFTRDASGAEVWLVCVKGTFDINPDGSTTLASAQEPICLAPRHAGEPGKSSLLYDTDMVLTKPATDVILHGSAHTPPGEPALHVDVRLQVGPLSKTLRVFGRRWWTSGALGLMLSEPEPFERAPLSYEHAFGGVDEKHADPAQHAREARNPVGTGFAMDPEHLVDTLACSVEDPDDLITTPRQRPRPAGFGPVDRHWAPRAQLAGTYDRAWEDERRPLSPLDFQERFYQCAPEDQHITPHLRGGEEVVLTHLTPEGTLRFTLPRVALGFETELGDELVHHRQSLHTVIIEPDARRMMLVWHTALPCHHTLYTLHSTTVREKQVLPRASDPE